MRITQPVLLQSFTDKFGIKPSGKLKTPAEAGKILVKCEPKDVFPPKEHKKYLSGVGKLLYLMRWLQPEIMNLVCELSRHMSCPNQAHMKAMNRVMQYCVDSPKQGWYFNPNNVWNGGKDHEFTVGGKSDSNYSTCPDTRHSVSGYESTFEGVPAKSAMQ